MKEQYVQNVYEELKKGKKIYVGYCMNADVNGIPMEFQSNKEAIHVLSDYEAEIYQVILKKDEIVERLIYDPFECFG